MRRRPAALIPRSSRISATSSASSSGSAICSAQAAAAVAALSVALTCAKICISNLKKLFSASRSRSRSGATRLATRAAGSGAAPGKAPVTCRSCEGRGQVRYQQGFFSIARTCPTCQGSGSVITDPCPKCKGEGRQLRERMVEAKVPGGVEDGTRIRFRRPGRGGSVRRPGWRSVYCAPCQRASFLRARGQRPALRGADFVLASPLGTEIMVPTLEGEHRLKVPEGTQSGTSFRIRGKGVPVLNGHGKGDLFRGSENSDARETQQAAARTADRIRRADTSRKQATAALAAGASERYVCVGPLSAVSHQPSDTIRIGCDSCFTES